MPKHTTSDRSLPDTDLRAIARKTVLDAGFMIELSPQAAAELARLDRRQIRADASIRDLRDLPWLSIDNPESRDLDQVSVAEALPHGATRVLVGLADVDAFVPLGSALDRHAAANTTSLYTGVEVFPMLPERISTDLSSLNEQQDRLAVVVELRVTAEGALSASDIYRALVRNHRRVDYETVGAWLEGDSSGHADALAEPALAEQLRLQDGAMSALRAQRERDGALDFETIEARPVVQDGRVVDLVVQRKNRARALIEQMMVSSNSAVASYLEAHGFPAIARALDPPERWDRMVAVAARLGDTLPAAPDSRALAAFLARRRAADPEHFSDLSLTIVKLLGGSHYQAVAPGADDPGHFGLAVEDYTHATAPNRRYPDLVTQRLLKAALAGQPAPYTFDELTAIAAHCSERASAANKVERRMRKVTAIVLLEGREGEVFDAIVTGVTGRGVFARLLRPPAEGRIMRGEHGLDVGDHVRLRLTGTDLERGFIDFERA
jgi:exoribonuclease-2